MFKKITSLSFIIYFFLNVSISFSQPFISPDEITVQNATTITFTLSEELNISEGGVVTGFTVAGVGSLSLATYSDKGVTNLITIIGSGFSGGVTTVSYTAAVGNVLNLSAQELADITSHSTVVQLIYLAPGDIAITGYTCKDDEFSFVLLKDMPVGTVIKFTDNGWTGTNLRTDESTISWEADQNLFAGTEIIIYGDFIASTIGVVFGSTMNLSCSGDQVIAYQGTSANPTFIAAFQLGNEGTRDFSTNWHINGSNDVNRSVLPSGLINYVDALSIWATPDGAKYDRSITTGDPMFLLVDINFEGNWIVQNNVFLSSFGATFFLPPNISALAPINNSIIKADYSTLQITFNENVTKDLSYGGNITITNQSDPTFSAVIPVSSASVTTASSIASVLLNAQSIILTNGVINQNLIDNTTYGIDVDGFLFENTDGNHNAPIVGSTEWNFTYDATPPTVSSIIRASSNPHNAGINNGEVEFTVTFSENVNGVDVTDFLVSASSTNIIGTPVISDVSFFASVLYVTVSGFDLDDAASLGTLNLDLNTAGTITDDAGNDNVSDVVTGLDETYTIINPEPAESISSLSSSSQTGTSINLNWTNSIVDQIAYQHLLLVKETTETFPVVLDGSFINDDVDLSDGVMVVNAGHGISSYEVTGLNSGVTYDFKIYPYTNDGANVDYNTATPATLSQATLLGSTTSITYSSSPATLSSLATTSGLGVTNFAISITDDGVNPSIDNAPTLINQLIISRNDPFDDILKWTEVIENAELSDGVNGVLATSIDDANITFSAIANSNEQLGEIDDNETKIYSLKIWLKSDLSGSLNLPQTIDGLNFVFKVMESNIMVESISSNFAISTISSGTSNNEVSVNATQLDFTTDPDPSVEVFTNFVNPPIVEARDVNGNVDLDFGDASETVSVANTNAIGMLNLEPSDKITAVNGVITFPANFQYETTGNGTLLITDDGAVLAPPVNPQTVTVNPISISSLSSSTGNGTYYETESTNIEVNFSQSVTLASGLPTLTLNSGGAANYVSGSGTNQWMFSYTVGKDEFSTDLDVSVFNLNGGVFSGISLNAIDLSMPAVNTLATNQNIIIALFNHAPLINTISDPAAIDEDAAEQIINISGITDGNSGLQTVNSIIASSNNTALIPHPVITYTPDATSGSLAYTPVSNAFGTATITLTVSDDGGLANGGIDKTEINFDVTVTPVNDAPTISELTFAIDENSVNGTTVGTVLFGDVDSGNLSLSITSGNTNTAFSIDNSGVISVADEAELNFETTTSYVLEVRVEDDAIIPLATSVNITININDINDDPTDIILGVNETTIFISDPTPGSTFLRTVRAVDEDISILDQKFSLPADEIDNAAFSIVLDNGDYKLSTKQEINSTIKGSFNIRIRYEDGLGGFIEELFTVAFGSGNIPPSEINLDSKSVFERLPSGALVGTLSTIDPDDTNHTYDFVTAAGGEDNGLFSINGDQLVTNEVFDFVSKSSYSILVKSTDSQNQTTQNFNFIISIDQFINNNPTDIVLSNSTVDEKLASDVVIGSLTASDVDIDDIGIDQIITFDLVSGSGSTDNASFSISGNELRSIQTFDYLIQNSYLIRIQALDSDGGVYEEEFTIAINDVTSPLLITKNPSHNAEGVSTNPILSLSFDETVQAGSGNIEIHNMTDESVALSFDITESAVVFNNTNKITMSQPLSDGNEYYITIDATAIEDLSGNNFLGINATDVWSFTTIDETSPQISADSSNPSFIDNGSGSIVLASTITDNSGAVSEVTFSYKLLSQADSKFIPLTPTVDGDKYSVEVQKSIFLGHGIDYKFEAQDAAGNFAEPLKGNVYFRYGDSEIDQEGIPDLSFGGRVKDYQVVSIPYLLADTRISSVFNELIGFDNTEWRILQHNSDGITLKEYPQSLNLIELGKSYWLNVKDPMTINVNAREVTSNSQDDPFTITLVPGWNQIGNPYPIDVSWNDVINANPTLSAELGKLRVFNSENESIVDGNMLEVWGGGFVDWSGSANVELIIPLESTTGGRLSDIAADFSNEGWMTELSLSSGVMQTAAGFGMHPEAVESKDRFDAITAPRFFNYLELNFYHNENILPKFSTDIGEMNENKVWNFSIETNLTEKKSLSWGVLSEEIYGKSLVLHDLSTNRRIDMNEISNYVFKNSGKRDFKIAFGDENFVEEALMPSKVTLGQSAPNPFSTSAIIPFTIPNKGNSRVELKIYDVLGNEIKGLVSGYLESGYHAIKWNGTDSFNNDVSNGVYIYRLYVNNNLIENTLSGKLLKIGN